MDYIDKIEAIVGGENVRRDEIERLCYSRDLTVHEGIPDLIVFAKDSNQVSKVLAIANEEKIPVTPRGSGTSWGTPPRRTAGSPRACRSRRRRRS